MIVPIVAFGHQALRNENQEVTEEHPQLKELVANMFETMYNAKGVGLAAPQIGLPLRMFVVDGKPMEGVIEGDTQSMDGFKKVFINPEIVDEGGDEWAFEEGCLSIPDVREDIWRPESLLIRYYDTDFNLHEEELHGVQARIVQHEFDHLEGVLFTDYLKGLKKTLLKSRLKRISGGNISVSYPMEFPQKKK